MNRPPDGIAVALGFSPWPCRARQALPDAGVPELRTALDEICGA